MILSLLATAGLLLGGPPKFADETVERGLPAQRLSSGEPAMAGGVAWIDWDNDTHPDLVLTGDVAPVRVFRNTGPGGGFNFEEVSAQTGALATLQGAMSVERITVAGRPGLVFAVAPDSFDRLAQPRLFAQEQPAGPYSAVPLPNMGGDAFFASHGDLDGDGDHDLILGVNGCSHGPAQLPRVFRLDQSHGVFKRRDAAPWPAAGCSPVTLVTDYYGNGQPAVMVVNDFGPMLTPTTVVSASGQADTGLPGVYGMGVAAGDMNGDGRSDYYLSSIGRDVLWTSAASGFSDQTEALVLPNSWGENYARYKWGAAFLDADNDGDLELWVTAGFQPAGDLYFNDGAQRTSLIDNGVDIAAEAGVDTETNDRTVALADFDGDGRLDAIVGSVNWWALYRNITEAPGHYLEIALDDEPGTRITTTGCGQTWAREWVSGAAGAAHQPLVHVGVGDCTGPLQVTIDWPWAGRSEFANVAVDTRIQAPRPRPVTLEPAVAQPGQLVIVRYQGSGKATLDGGALTDGQITTTAPEAPGGYPIALVVDGKPLPYAPELVVVSGPRFITTPSPPRIGAPAAVWAEQDGAWANAGTLTAEATSHATSVEAFGNTYPLTVEAVADVDPQSRFEVRPDGDSMRVTVEPVDGLGLPHDGELNVHLIRDGVVTNETIAAFDPSFYEQSVQRKTTQVLGITIDGVQLDLSVTLDALGTAALDPTRTELFVAQQTVYADGMDLVQLLVYPVDSQGQPMDADGLTVQAEGLSWVTPDEWRPTFVDSHPFFGTFLMADTQPGQVLITVAGVTTTVNKRVAWHLPVDIERTSLEVTDGLAILRPRDARGHLIGSGVTVDNGFRYAGQGRYVRANASDPITATLESCFTITRAGEEVSRGRVEAPGGCSQGPEPTSKTALLIVLLALTALVWRRGIDFEPPVP